MGKISIYQVFTRLFGNSRLGLKINGNLKENGSAKMNDFTPEVLMAIKDLGITHIWYTGIIEHATCEQFSEYNIQGQHPSIVKGRAGSPYAITDYYDVNAYLAENIPNRMAEFEALVERTHNSELKVIIDFVPNHVARQYNSDIKPETNFGNNDDTSKEFLATNDFYYIPNESLHLAEGMGTVLQGEKLELYDEKPAKATGNDQFHAWPSVNDWYETVKLNYGVDYKNNKQTHFDPTPPVWDKMVDILLFWCSKNVDGIRCDMAEMVPVEFWEYAISKVKTFYPNIVFIAEVYNPNEYNNYIFKGGFDYLYDKVGLYDCLRNIICHDSPAHNISACWESLGGIDANMLRFLENHDEHRIASEYFAKEAHYALPAMVVSATLNTGPVMTYFGQEFGEPAKGVSGYSGNDGRTTIFDFYHVPEHLKWVNNGKYNGGALSVYQKELYFNYSRLLNFCIKSEAIAEGKFYDLMWCNKFEGGPDTRFIYAYLRYTQNERLLIVVNFHKHNSHNFKLKIPEHALEQLGFKLNPRVKLNDFLSNQIIENISMVEAAYEGIKMELKPLESYIFKID